MPFACVAAADDELGDRRDTAVEPVAYTVCLPLNMQTLRFKTKRDLVHEADLKARAPVTTKTSFLLKAKACFKSLIDKKSGLI